LIKASYFVDPFEQQINWTRLIFPRSIKTDTYWTCDKLQSSSANTLTVTVTIYSHVWFLLEMLGFVNTEFPVAVLW